MCISKYADWYERVSGMTFITGTLSEISVCQFFILTLVTGACLFSGAVPKAITVTLILSHASMDLVFLCLKSSASCTLLKRQWSYDSEFNESNQSPVRLETIMAGGWLYWFLSFVSHSTCYVFCGENLFSQKNRWFQPVPDSQLDIS